MDVKPLVFLEFKKVPTLSLNYEVNNLANRKLGELPKCCTFSVCFWPNSNGTP